MMLFRYIGKTSQLKIRNGKVAVFVLLMLMLAMDYNRPLIDFSQETGYGVSWCLFPFLMANFTYLALFWFGVLYVNSDIPFSQHNNMYQIVRTGRRIWGIGQIAGIGVRSAVLSVAAAICAAVPVFPVISLSNDWGKLMYTASVMQKAADHNLKYIIYYGTLAELSPLEMMGLTLIVTTLSAFFVGVFMFAVCLYTNRTVAVASTTALTVLLFWVLNTLPQIRLQIARFVPVIWPQVARLNTPERGYYWLPSVPYMLFFLVSGIFILSVLIMMRIRRLELDWEDEDI